MAVMFLEGAIHACWKIRSLVPDRVRAMPGTGVCEVQLVAPEESLATLGDVGV
jgi:hypothetical protein